MLIENERVGLQEEVECVMSSMEFYVTFFVKASNYGK